MPNSSRPHGLQPTRLLCPWDFPGKDAGVGCHFLPKHCFNATPQLLIYCFSLHSVNRHSDGKLRRCLEHSVCGALLSDTLSYEYLLPSSPWTFSFMSSTQGAFWTKICVSPQSVLIACYFHYGFHFPSSLYMCESLTGCWKLWLSPCWVLDVFVSL